MMMMVFNERHRMSELIGLLSQSSSQDDFSSVPFRNINTHTRICNLIEDHDNKIRERETHTHTYMYVCVVEGEPPNQPKKSHTDSFIQRF